MEDLTEQAKHFGAEFVNTNCASIDTSSWPYSVHVPKGIIKAKSIILSTGADAIWLGAEQEDEYKGKGISTCATCDGFMFRDKPVVVIGGGDSAMEEATFLTRFASSVTLIHRRDKFRASKVMLNRALANSKIRIMTDTEVVGWQGQDGLLCGATVRNTQDGATEELKCDGAFIAIGHQPNTGFLDRQVTLDKEGFIALQKHTMTNVPGVFACGDVADTRYKQAITAAGSGCQAAIDAERWLEDKEHEAADNFDGRS
jgi:thioredoxin reductase (NADPH)